MTDARQRHRGQKDEAMLSSVPWRSVLMFWSSVRAQVKQANEKLTQHKGGVRGGVRGGGRGGVRGGRNVPELLVLRNAPELLVQRNVPELLVLGNVPELLVQRNLLVLRNAPELLVPRNVPELLVPRNAPELLVPRNAPELEVWAANAALTPPRPLPLKPSRSRIKTNAVGIDRDIKPRLSAASPDEASHDV
ncbi:hypothetical protein EYF80_055544 [Liparis tanakae]|uniref:Uncharacterized protein n=1 Tax=Liparis tanakae TaxID=230148 RepID=A0A4Z2F0K2_9TELE|nr:hypothetical protein EYF80_055544 [Liparis tanakae]